MTGVPDEIVLMGDNVESDPLIYETFKNLLKREIEPWTVWNRVKNNKAFELTTRQNARLLNKIYQLDNLLLASSKKTNITIHIRK